MNKTVTLTEQQAAAVREALEHTRKMMQKNRDESDPASASETSLSEVIRMLGGYKVTNSTALTSARRLCIAAGFEPDGDNTYTSREGGNGTDCEPDPGTLATARRLVQEIKALGLKASREVCDEWVSVIINAEAVEMSKAEKAALARMLEDIAARLESAPGRAEDAAKHCGEETLHARRCYEIGALQAQVREAMHAIRTASTTYLNPTKKAG